MSTAINDKVKTPFSKADRNQLMAWSKLAKEKGLLFIQDRCELLDLFLIEHVRGDFVVT